MKIKILLFALFLYMGVNAQQGVGIGKTSDDYTILDLSSSANQGLLTPRVDLTSTGYDLNTDGDGDISNQPEGLMIYNMGGSPNSLPKGFYFWNGQEWRMISDTTSSAPDATFTCSAAILDPAQMIIGEMPVISGTVIKLPYTLGNGGVYKGVILESVGNPNLKATIANGQFESGSGYIALFLTGTPTSVQTAPTGITFDLTPFYDANPSISLGCTTITVGTEVKAEMKTVAVIDNMKLVNDPFPMYVTQLTTPDGRFSVRAYIVSSDYNSASASFNTNSPYGMNLIIRNNTGNEVMIAGQFTYISYGEFGSNGNGQNKLKLKSGKWSGDQAAGTSSEVYAGYLQAGATNICTGANTSATNACIFGHWGNDGIYRESFPERRTYSWIINDDGADKTAYILTFSSSSLSPDDRANSATCPSGICKQTKVFMKINQIRAN